MGKKSGKSGEAKLSTEGERLSPSALMRDFRPEYYSDTKDRVSYALDRATFEHFLETLTARNETHDFEIFCRKLCERTICPHLRPNTVRWTPKIGPQVKMDFRWPAGEKKADYESQTETA